ncbi:cytochrome b-c1 complex subunit 10-like [Hypanus sabinus]|uniref:cytochrome b-c1 complex subunit 10-like n=1 Tax=Hypanus sabinus TaxID=79690 RepID=UPI0028C4B672|nr:cytochrome b-c1 complex subunit 10-like [Hypanus sabinus]
MWAGRQSIGRGQTATRMLEQILGPRHRQLLKNWIPIITTWGAVAGVLLVYATDRKVVVSCIPYIKRKFKSD